MAQEQPTQEAEKKESLFADDQLSDFRSRWNEIQVGFVDDPRQAVEQADALVSDLVEQLTAGFSEARSRLEDQWTQGEEASTEDLRIALTRYRSFFKRLLEV
ncbi:MAG: hypothetical protein ACRDQ2_15865 [Gaiellales bacterium]